MDVADKTPIRDFSMIHLTRLNRTPIVLNADLIEHIELTPDTVISLTNGEKIRVLESADDVIKLVVDWRRKITERAIDGEHE